MEPEDASADRLDERTRSSLVQIQVLADVAAQLVARGKAEYLGDTMLWLAGEAILRRLDDAVSGLDESFLDRHPEIDWAAMCMARDIGSEVGEHHDAYWGFMRIRLAPEVARVARILRDWETRPLAHPVGPVASLADPPLTAGSRPGGGGCGPGPSREFRELVERLDDWAASASAPDDNGPIHLVMPGGRRIEIVLSADDLADMMVLVATVDGALLNIKDGVRGMPDEAPYLVYGTNYLLEARTSSPRDARAD